MGNKQSLKFYITKNKLLEDEIEKLKNENNNRFAKGFKQGQNSIKRKNESGCCCIINDNDEIESLCGLHRELVDIKIAKLKNEREILQSAYRSLRMKG